MMEFFETSKEEASKMAIEAGFPAFRIKQIFEWIYEKSILDLDEMTNLGKDFKQYIRNNYNLRTIKVLKMIKDSKEETIKILLELSDGNTLEMVIMRYLNKDSSKERNTLCLSSQVGCPVGCPFCATGMSGYIRNLTVGEIVEQVAIANEYLKKAGARINNIVFMGMGEPLFNRANVFAAACLIRDNFIISSRRITISTSGVTDGIRAMADNGLKFVLAISLHGARDELRDILVPLNRKYPLAQLIMACKYYQQKTGKRITFEYIMIDQKNLTERDAKDLAVLLKGIDCHINGIPINSVKGSVFKRPSKKTTYWFKNLCENYGLSFSIREEKGLDIEGACGQLRNKERKEHESDCDK